MVGREHIIEAGMCGKMTEARAVLITPTLATTVGFRARSSFLVNVSDLPVAELAPMSSKELEDQKGERR